MRIPAFLVICLFSVVLGAEFVRDGLNSLTKENLDIALKNNITVLALWYGPNCQKCKWEGYNIYKMIYSFLDQETFLVMGADFGTIPELEEEIGIEGNAAYPEYRIFLRGSREPLANHKDIGLIDWISSVTGFIPQRNYVHDLTDANWSKFTRDFETKCSLIHFYAKSLPNVTRTVIQLYRTAKAFKNNPKVALVRVNCATETKVCGEFEVKDLPSYRLVSARGEPPKVFNTTRGEGMVQYINKYCMTMVSADGGLSEEYGRDRELDKLAHEFASATSVESRSQIMKTVVRLRNKYKSSSRYFKLMKEAEKSISEDMDAEEQKEAVQEVIENELSEVRKEISKIDGDHVEYPKLRARENVAAQFEDIPLTGDVVTLHPWNWDHVINGKRTVFVHFNAPWSEETKKFLPHYNGLAKEGYKNVVFGEIDAAKYVDHCAQFGMGEFPVVKVFVENESVDTPTDVPAERSKAALKEFADQLLRQVKDKVDYKEMMEKEQKRAAKQKEEQEALKATSENPSPPEKIYLNQNEELKDKEDVEEKDL